MTHEIDESREPVLETEFDWDSTSPSVAVVKAVASLENKEPSNLDWTMYEYVDTEALNEMLRSNPEYDIHVELDVEQYEVELNDEGCIRLYT
jgi:hypothetical protein